MDQINNLHALSEVLNTFSKRGTNTNNYFLHDNYRNIIDEHNLFFIKSDSNACLIENRTDYYKLYFFINTFNEFIKFSPDKPVVMEILYRGENNLPQQIMNYWSLHGFKRHLVRDLFIASHANIINIDVDSERTHIKLADSDDEIKYVKYLIDKTFDKYTGDILSMEEVKRLVYQGNILCASVNGSLAGILQFEIKNNTVWIGHLAVDENYRGRGIARDLVAKYISCHKENSNYKFHLWVIQDNEKARNLYSSFGFYFGNKSSASMLLTK